MKAVAVFPESHQVKLIEQEVPRLSRPDQVMVRLLDVGICGTDTEICSFAYGTPPPGDDHLVIGHESLAEIVEARAGTGPDPGQADRHQDRDRV
jgi:threonine dehydrogenase-like Zn-dependent dehydrogenase